MGAITRRFASRVLRRGGRALAALLLATGLPAGAASVTAAGDADALRALLTAGRTPATVEAAPADRGCGPRGCVIDIDGLRIDRERGQLRSAQGQRLRLHNTPSAASKSLPTIDWELLGGYRVMQQGQRWGTCLEFSHTGIGKSGSFQRWTSVLLVPWAGQHPGRDAWRMLAYWGGCEALTDGEQPGEVVLPTVQAVAGQPGALAIVQHHCRLGRCSSRPDPRSVRADPAQPGGGLLVEAP